MNTILVFIELSIVLLFLFFISAIFNYLYPIILEKAGESYVKKELKKLNDEYVILNDILIKSGDSSTHQIDHIVVSKYGIFVIETKQYNGYIKGNENDKKWIMNKKYINNPLYQNYGHIKVLAELLNIDCNNFINIVCFSGNVKVNVKSNNLVGILQLLNKIKSYNTVIFDDINYIVDSISINNIMDKKVLKEHINNVKKYDVDSCPICGGKLIECNGKYGKFVGCCNYPNCKYTKKRS